MMVSRIISFVWIFIISISEVLTQCNGPAMYILPNNSTGNLAFPESNLDPISGTWIDNQVYPGSVSCTWVLKAPPEHVLYLKILHFDTEEKFDYVTLYSTEDRKEKLFEFSGDLKDILEAVTPDNTLTVDFFSDEFTTYSGFHFAYRYMPKACVAGGVNIDEPQLIALPPWNLQGVLPGPRRPGFEAPDVGMGIPLLKEDSRDATPRWTVVSSYPQGLNCTWHITLSPKQLLQIDVLKFQTDEDDILQIWQIENGELRPLLKYWNDQIPRDQIQSSSPLLLNFASRISEHGSSSGFLFNVSYISRACNSEPQEITLPRGLIGYPSHNLKEGKWQTENAIHYGPDSCEWVLNAPEGYSLNFTILEFDTRPQDMLEITDGNKSIMKHGGPFPENPEVISTGNQLIIKFVSKSETQKTGFLIHYSWVLRDCRFELNPHEGELRSPYYPDTYRDDMKCHWKLTPPKGFLVHFVITRLRLDEGDYVQITDGEKTVFFTDSSANTGLLEFAPTSSIAINFLTDSHNSKGYFLLKYNSFRPGSCNFSLTTCGWTSIDPLQVWTFKDEEKMMIVEEKPNIGLQLPRGYRTQASSPLIEPTLNDEVKLSAGQPMCLLLDYILTGQDAFKLTVSIQEDNVKENFVSFMNSKNIIGQNEKSSTLMEIHGPHGPIVLTAAANFTVSNPFHIMVAYERGYGPHYRVGVSSVKVTSGWCELVELSSFSCDFNNSFCGWRNTHTDQRNWQLGNTGVSAMINENLGMSWLKKRSKFQHQFADLLSPTITSSDLQGSSDVCLTLSYQIHTSLAELQLIVMEEQEKTRSGRFFKRGHQKEEEIWSQGKADSHKILKANIPLKAEDLPKEFKVLLRTVSVKGNNSPPAAGVAGAFGVSVQEIALNKGACANMFQCSFDEGFCSWRITSTGNTVWHVLSSKDYKETFAAILSHGYSSDTTQLISPQIESNEPKTISFRYHLKHTNQCLKVATTEQKNLNEETASLNVIWEQCKEKGKDWLYECINLPNSDNKYQVVIKSGTGSTDSEVWIDDLEITSNPCLITKHIEEPSETLEDSPLWECQPSSSLCGMTQPLTGSWDWVFYRIPQQEDSRHVSHPQQNSLSNYLTSPSAKIDMEENSKGFNHFEIDKFENRNLRFLGLENMGSKIPNLDSLHEMEYSDLRNFGLSAHNNKFDEKTSNRLACPDGRILEPSWACDGVPDCDDNSDEKDCDCGPEGCGNNESQEVNQGICNGGAFMCRSGRVCPLQMCSFDLSPCLPRSFVCDGHPHCIEGEDEQSCNGVLHEVIEALGNEWLGDGPQVTETRSEYGIQGNSGDYKANNHPMSTDRFECSGGLMVPKAFRCDGRKDCPLDGLDEVGCFHCGLNDFLCPTSGVCLPKSVVCDGELSMPTCTDELACHACSPGHFACDVCIPSFKLCDGVWDCNEGEDEIRCGGLTTSSSNSNLDSSEFHLNSDHQESFSKGTHQKCQESHFKCYDDRCLPIASVCNRQRDCTDGEDEQNCNDDNLEEEFYISAKPSSAPNRDPWSKSPSYFITPVLQQLKGAVGLLTFKYRLDAWVGPSNVTLSVEVLSATEPTASLVPWALWRQSGHKGRLWLNAQVIIPEVPNTDKYKIAFLLTGNELPHRSQQVHLSNISFKILNAEALQPIGLERAKCEFLDSWCGWTQAYTERGYSWVHAMASNHARRTGPITGFPEDGSGFIFADSLQGYEGDTADLLSPPILLPKEQTMCFRFAVFLYGAHVAKLSVHAMQINAFGHTFTNELFYISGGRGLSWVPVTINLGEKALKDVSEPFVIIIRATRGNGPEGDIALDHIAFLKGGCEDDSPELEPDLEMLLTPAISSSTAHIYALTAGPSLSHYTQTGIETTLAGSFKNNSVKTDLCNLFESCFKCVTSSLEGCIWCDATHTCSDALSLDFRMCPPSLVIRSNSTEDGKSGPKWCPRIVPGQSSTIFLPVDLSLSVMFAVTNIQPTQTNGNWACIINVETEAGDMQMMDHTDEIAKNGLQSRSSQKGKNSEEEEEEELWRSLKKYAIKKKYKQKQVKVIGEFEGTMFRSGEGLDRTSEVGIGAIRCGDGETLLKLPEGVKMARANVELRTPAGNILDNPENVNIVAYSCESITSDCESCIGLNNSFACGWCSFTQACTHHSHCTSGLWHSHSSTPADVCSVQDELDFLKTLLESEEDNEELGNLEEELFDQDLNFVKTNTQKLGGKKKIKNKMRKSLGNEKEKRVEDASKLNSEKRKKIKKNKTEEEEKSTTGKARVKDGAKDGAKEGAKENVKIGKKGRGKGFLKVPIEDGVFVARDVWRLHTGRQYYVPVTKKTLINLGFVRHITYGRLDEEKSRTLLMDGAWKKAAGYFIDMYEKAGQDPVTSVITINKSIFDKLLVQLQPE